MLDKNLTLCRIYIKVDFRRARGAVPKAVFVSLPKRGARFKKNFRRVIHDFKKIFPLVIFDDKTFNFDPFWQF